MKTEATLIQLDYLCDEIPFISTITNLIDLFQKYVVFPMMDESVILESHYFTHIKNKSSVRSTFLLFPIFGNLIVRIDAWTQTNEDKRSVSDKEEASAVIDEADGSIRDKEDVSVIANEVGESIPDKEDISVVNSEIDENVVFNENVDPLAQIDLTNAENENPPLNPIL